MEEYDAFASTHIRIIFGLVGFIILIAIMGRYKEVGLALQSKKGMSRIMLGSVFGPFLGVSFSLIAVKYASAGVASPNGRCSNHDHRTISVYTTS